MIDPRAVAEAQVEQGLLGLAMLDVGLALQCEDVRPEHFGEAIHARLWSSIQDKARSGRAADMAVLAAEFGSDPGFQSIGGMPWLAEVVDKCPMAPALPEYARSVREAALRRSLLGIGQRLVLEDRESGSAFERLAQTERDVVALLNNAAPPTHALIDARKSARQTLAEIEEEARTGKPRGAMTGLRCFDRRLQGLQPGALIILAGRPSMGKTGLARAAALGCARRNPDALVPFFCLEMERREIDERTLAQISYEAGDGIEYRDMKGDKLSSEQRGWLADLSERIPDNLLLEDTPTLTVDYVRRRVTGLRQRGRRVAAVFIDYLQIMQRPPSEGSNDAAIIQKMTQALKQLARETKTAVVLLSQLSRKVEEREDKRPLLSDLRESGAIEQDANAVLFAYREAYYLDRVEPKRGKEQEHAEALAECYRQMDVICAKNRGGPVGTDVQTYFAEFDTVKDREDGYA